MIEADKNLPYCLDLFQRKRLPTIEVTIGNLKMGGENPIRVQSMTTTDTMDTEGSVAQSIRMIDAGCELVRLTAPSKNEAENLLAIKRALVELGYETPLVADIHFTPNAAEIAAQYVEKVRVNPGNYADKKKFETLIYDDASYKAELERIAKKFVPLIKLCKEHKRAMRIGTNHGSLSDRILSRYGDTPEGMVESAMEFIRICEQNEFYDLVISMKASNTLVMVQAYRLLVATMLKNGRCYPLHLGVTEAGDGEDGRIKSAVGIGALLEDGIGDTIRVSLTEEPEEEIPVAKKIIQNYAQDEHDNQLPTEVLRELELPYSPFHFSRRESLAVNNIGNKQVPVVVVDLSDRQISHSLLFSTGYSYSKELDKWNIMDQAADYIYVGKASIDFEIPGTLGIIQDFQAWKNNKIKTSNYYPLLRLENLDNIETSTAAFLLLDEGIFMDDNFENYIAKIKQHKQLCLIIHTSEEKKSTHLIRLFNLIFAKYDINLPLIVQISSTFTETEDFLIQSSIQSGIHFIDGYADGLWLSNPKQSPFDINKTAFGILQATRSRISKTEYISCPSCGRTLFDLQETTQKIRKQTEHLKGIKIGIMGCIVNGPGEMADADYGYVGTGPGKINLYKEKTVIKKNVPEEDAVNELIDLIKTHGDWIEPKI